MSNRYVIAGMWFFSIAAALGFAIVVIAPVFGIRMLGLIGLTSAMAGFALHLNELRDTDPRTYAALGERLRALVHHQAAPQRVAQERAA